jgi:acetyl esterase/lipase
LAFLRAASWRSFAQAQAEASPTGQNIKNYCKNNGLDLKLVDVSSESDVPAATLHFIHLADKPTKSAIFYLHGGGYIHPIDVQGQLPFLMECARAAGVSDLILLEYTLAPELRYPGQLAQGVNALEVILREYEGSQIMLGGDSAGGHFVLSLLAHAKQPNPNVEALPAGLRFHSAYLISPWVSMKYDSKTFTTNNSRDFINSKSMAFCNEQWKPVTSDIHAECLAGSTEFWRDIPVDKILLTTGTWEVFYDDDLAMAELLGAKPFDTRDAKVELSIGEKEIHVMCSIDKAMGISRRGTAADIMAWLDRIGWAEGEN